MIIVNSKECLKYSQRGQAESPRRVSKTLELLERENFKFIPPKNAHKLDLIDAHGLAYVKEIEDATFPDEEECPKYPHIFEYASIAAGSALTALAVSLNGDNSFSLMRPPGHHAGIKPMGFCYFNNIAIAALKASNYLDRVAILDIDYHHGNGTQEIVLGNEKILHADIHEANAWPYTGNLNNHNCLNFLVDKETTEKTYLDTLDLALSRVESFKPNLIMVSAGFDTFEEDPVGGLLLMTSSYRKIGEKINKLSQKINAPVCSILEGGYSDKLADCILSYLKGFE